MTKKRNQKPIEPDEVFVRGPVRVARYGSNVVYESNWPEGAFADFQQRTVAQYPEVVNKIDELVEAIATLVRELPPHKILHRAWWEFAIRAINVEAEADVGIDDAVAIRMIDYIQSVIASVKPAENQKEDVTEEEWQALRANVDKLFHTLMLDYQICRTAKAKAEDPNFDDEVEEFFYKAQIYWCGVRGDRYQVHQNAYLNELFLPHSAVLQELFGISAGEFVEELTKIGHSLTFGIQEIVEEMESFRKDTTDAVKNKLKAQPPQGKVSLPALMKVVVAENGWETRQERLFGRFFGTDLYDVKKITALPQALIDELAWGPGEEPDFFADGEFRGWPLRIWPVFKRPFIRLNGRYYCFDLYILFDNIYRIMQRVVLRLKPDYGEAWNRIQKELSEELPFKYLQKILPGSMVYRNVYH